MYVKMLIGRNAGSVADLPYDAATSGISMGTHVRATEAEIAAAGLHPANGPSAAPPEEFPAGYTAVADGPGYSLIGPDGEPVRKTPFRNLLEARCHAWTLMGTVRTVDDGEAPAMATSAEETAPAADKPRKGARA